MSLQPSQYVAGGGSVRDVGPDPKANIAIVTAAALAIAGIASGLITNFQSKPRGETYVLPAASALFPPSKQHTLLQIMMMQDLCHAKLKAITSFPVNGSLAESVTCSARSEMLFQASDSQITGFAAPIEDEPGQYLTLSQYKDKFAASEGVAEAPSVN